MANPITTALMKLMPGKDNDKKTTTIATIKTTLAIVASIAAIFHVEIGDSIQMVILILAISGYVVFEWIQGFFINKKDE